MSKILTALLTVGLSLFAGQTGKAQTFTGDLILTTQAEVDAFNYTSVTGNLTIDETVSGNIVNLNGLSELVTIGGYIVIVGNSSLNDISGLSNLETVGGNFIISENDALPDIGLNKVTTIGGNLSIRINHIADISGFNGLTSVGGGKITIKDNFHLANISGFNALTSINELDILALNSQLSHLDGFNDLTTVTGDLELKESVLVDIHGLSSLTTVEGFLVIAGNRYLTDISGLSNLETVGGNFIISENDALPDIGLNKVTTIGGNLSIRINHIADISGFNGLTSVGGGKITIKDNFHLANISGFNALTSINELDILALNSQLSHLDGFNDLTRVTGDLELKESVLVDIHGFSSLTSVEGFLVIAGNRYLTDISGLSNLETVGGNFIISENDALPDIGLNKVTTIGGNLSIRINHIADISGFNGLTSVGGGKITIKDNFHLANISGFNALTSINELDILAFNSHLSHLDGFNDLTTVTGNLELKESVLVDIQGFSSLTSVEGFLVIAGNRYLTDITGLSNLETVGGNFIISENDALPDIGLNKVTTIGGNLSIRINHIADISGFNGLTSVSGGKITIDDNFHLANISGFNALTSINELDITASNSQLSHLDGFNGLTSIIGSLSITYPKLADVNGFTSLVSVGGLLIDGADVLTSIAGLNKLTTIGGRLYITDNPLLGQIDLNSLASIGESLIIDNNSLIVDLNSLINLLSVGGDLSITDNLKLSNFCGLYPLLSGNGLAGSYTVTGNASNPTKAEIIAAGGTAPVIANAIVSASTLAPPNHKLRDITVDYTATAFCGPVTTTLSVTSNEPVNGTGDGDTDPDWIIVDNHHVKLRAERSANGNGRIYTITITATNLVGATSTKTIEVRVAHNITGPVTGKSFKIGSTVDLSGEFWDKPTNKHTANWTLDENIAVKGTVTEPTASKNGKVTGSYKFTSAGVYKLQMNVTDQNKVVTYANTSGDLDAIVVIYDPNGGNTYGGGYFNSPAGALKANAAATGKASYGFAMNYFKNSTYPKGETQFEFKVGEFEFNALNFEYLVISNSMAQFKGTGKIIGGQSGVGFTMTVVDGQLDGTGIDKIRMKIYNKNNGTLIYDNQPGASDAALPTQAVGTNSIIVINGTNSSLTRSNTTQKVEMESAPENMVAHLDAIAYPNPSTNNFSVVVQAEAKNKIVMQIVDILGRVIETRNITAGSVIKFGDNYRPGTYFIRIAQGRQHKELKLVKISD